MQHLHAILQKHHLRLTQPRMVVFAALEHATKPLAISAIITACPAVDRVSVYRTIDLFSRTGIVVSTLHGWKQRYELAAPFRPHHHHLICTQCGRIIDIHSKKLEYIVAYIAARHQFEAHAHTFEIKGLCHNCHESSQASDSSSIPTHPEA